VQWCSKMVNERLTQRGLQRAAPLSWCSVHCPRPKLKGE
jgi:hypothetical protein